MYLLLCSQLSKRLPGIADPPTVSQVEESFKVRGKKLPAVVE